MPRFHRTGTRRPLPRWSAVAILAIVASIGLAACGGDDDDEDTSAATTETTEETTAAGGAETVDVSATDFKFDPDDPTVAPGEVTFKVTNDGEAPHNLEVEGPSGEAELPQDLQAGDSGEFTADLSEPGKYTFYCPVGNHEDLGMVGEVTVEG